MTDLISRDELLVAIQAGEHTTDTIVQIEAAPAVIPQVVCNITGGLLQGASATHRVDVYALDFDICDEELSEKIIVDGSEARLGQDGALVEPAFVERVINAPTMDEMVECSNCEWLGSIDECRDIDDLYQRVGPGEPMPAGECPKCGCLAHLTYSEDD